MEINITDVLLKIFLDLAIKFKFMNNNISAIIDQLSHKDILLVTERFKKNILI